MMRRGASGILRLGLVLSLSVAAAAVGEPIPLESLYRSALDHDAELARTQLELEAGRLDVADARSARYPTVRAEASGSLISNPMDAVTLTAGELGSVETVAGTVALPPEDLRLFDGMDSTRYEVAVVLEQPVFTWGKIPATIELAEAALTARIIGAEIDRRDMAIRLETQSLGLAILVETRRRLADQRELAAELVRISEESFRSGFILRADVLESRVRAAEIDLAIQEVDNRIETILVEVRSRTGRPELAVEDVAAPRLPELTDFPIPDMDSAIARSLSGSLEISLTSAQQTVRQAQVDVAQAGGTLRPDVGLKFRLSYSGPRLPFVETGWFGENTGNLVASVGFSTTVFDAGRSRRGVESARSESRRARNDSQAVAQTVQRRVGSDILVMELSAERYGYYTLMAESAREQAELKRTRAEAGAAGETEYLIEEIAALGHRIAALGEVSTYVQAALRIRAAAATAGDFVRPGRPASDGHGPR